MFSPITCKINYMENWDKLKQSTMDFMLTAVVNHVSNVLDDELTDEQQEQLLNLIMNVMTNSLLPDARLYWNEAIFDRIEKAQNVNTEDLFKKMGLR